MKNRKGIAVLIAVALLLCAGIGGTIAWLTAKSDEVKNTFEPGRVPPVISETISGTEKSDIYITNSGNVNAFLRAAVVVNWVNSAGQYVNGTLPALPSGLGSGWILHTDGYYYYTEAVAPGDATETPLFASAIEEPNDGPEGCHLQVTILAESVQADGMTDDGTKKAVKDAWGIDPSTLS